MVQTMDLRGGAPTHESDEKSRSTSRCAGVCYEVAPDRCNITLDYVKRGCRVCYRSSISARGREREKERELNAFERALNSS